jgi:CRP-like cAMP-binding protein
MTVVLATPIAGRTIGQSANNKSYVADSRLMEALEKRSKPIPCSDGRVLFKQGDLPIGLYVLRTGEAALLAVRPSGEEVESFGVTAGSLLCLKAVIDNEPYPLTAVAASGSDVLFVTRADFECLFRSEPFLYPRVLDVLAAQSREASKSYSSPAESLYNLLDLIEHVVDQPERVQHYLSMARSVVDELAKR